VADEKPATTARNSRCSLASPGLESWVSPAGQPLECEA
jgi:hypothetical protein